jgi:hypothetical protein
MTEHDLYLVSGIVGRLLAESATGTKHEEATIADALGWLDEARRDYAERHHRSWGSCRHAFEERLPR